MVNIDQLIEEESNKYVSSTALIELGRFCYEGTVTEREAEDMIETASQESFQAGASFILHQNRWRKVEDLYLIKSFPLDIIIRATQEDNKYYYTTTVFKNKDDLETIKYIIEIESVKDPKYSDSIEWKPII